MRTTIGAAARRKIAFSPRRRSSAPDADSPIIAYAIAQTNGQLEQLGDVFSSAPQGIVVSKDDTALTTAIQKAVQKLIDDGTYGKILAAWGNQAGAVKTAELNPTVS